jgi:hypothetical protein
MNTWTPLWSGIVDSSVWAEPDDVRIVFITMLALKDSDHVVRASAFGLARKANKTEKEVIAALKVLAAPDRKRVEPQPFDGRRVKKVEDGWLILNGETYRRKMSEEMKKARWRRAQAAKRNRAKGTPLPGEQAYEQAVNSGDHARAERLLNGE